MARHQVPKKADDLRNRRRKPKALGSLIAAVAASAGVSMAGFPAQASQAPLQRSGISEPQPVANPAQGKLVLKPALAQLQQSNGDHYSHESHSSHTSHSSHYSSGLQ